MWCMYMWHVCVSICGVGGACVYVVCVCVYLWYLYVGCLCICVCSLLRHSFTKLLQLKVSHQFTSQNSNLQILIPQLLKRLRSSVLHGESD